MGVKEVDATDTPVIQAEQIVSCQTAALKVVDYNLIKGRYKHLGIQVYDGNVLVLNTIKTLGDDIFVIDQYNTVYLMRDEHIEIRLLLLIREVRVAKDHAISRREARIFDRASKLSIKGIGVVGYDQTNHTRVALAQPPRQKVRAIIEFLYGLQHALSNIRVNRAIAVDDA